MEDEKKDKKDNGLFKLAAQIFDRNVDFREIPNNEKSKHAFMINRWMAINYPVQANMLNHIRINQVEVVDYWHSNLSKVYNRSPKWIFTSVKGGAKPKKDDWKPKTSLIKWYCEKYKVSPTDFESIILYPTPEFLSYLQQIEATLEKQSK